MIMPYTTSVFVAMTERKTTMAAGIPKFSTRTAASKPCAAPPLSWA
jgi:hypothetical protein